MDTRPELTNELVVLHRLTQTEIMIAEARRAQATSDRFERELAQNADKGRERLSLLDAAIRKLGGVPDVLGLAVGRVSAMTVLTLNQAQPLDEALLADLALEHQLHDRAVFAKVLAEASGLTDVVRLMQRLELAHAATIEWLTTRLAEIGVGGPPALAPAPTQAALGAVQRAAFLPSRVLARGVNRGVARLQELTRRSKESTGEAAARGRRLASAAGEVLGSGVAAGLSGAEREATKQDLPRTASAIHTTRVDRGVLESSELPIRGYDALNAPDCSRRIRGLQRPEDVRVVLAYEAAHKDRKLVRDAGATKLEALVDAAITA